MIANAGGLARQIYIEPSFYGPMGFMVNSIDVQSTVDVVPRFSTSEQGETDLDLMKVKSVKSFSGGQFQRQWDDDTKTSVTKGIYNEAKDVLLPTLPVTSADQIAQTDVKVNEIYSAQTADSTGTLCTYVLVQGQTGNVNYMYKLTPSGTTPFYTRTTVTLPAALATSASPIKHIYAHKGYLYVCNQTPTITGQNVQRYDPKANTWQDITGGIVKFASLRGVLYAVNGNCGVYSCTNETAAGAATWTLLALSPAGYEYPNDMITFNGAIWVSNPSGIYRFDGVSFVKVLNHHPAQLVEYNGAIYFNTGGWLYRFNGSVVEKVQFFGSISSMTVAGGVLIVITGTGGYFGADNISGGVYSNVYYFNGTSFFLLYEHNKLNPLQYTIALPTDDIVFVEYSSATWPTNLYTFRWSTAFNSSGATGRTLGVTSSELDAGYPNVWKSIQSLEVDYSGMVSGDVITLYVSYYDGIQWSAFASVGTISYTSTTNRIDLGSSYTGRLLQFRAVATTVGSASNLAFKRFSVRYSLQPRTRMQMRVSFMPFGNDPTQLVKDRFGVAITEDANTQSAFLSSCLTSKAPVWLIGPHFSYADAAYLSTDLTVECWGDLSAHFNPVTYPNETQFLAYTNNGGTLWHYLEVGSIQVLGSGATLRTAFTVVKRDYVGSGLAITTATIFAPAYRAYCTKLISDRMILSDETYNENLVAHGETQITHMPTYEFVEV